MSGLTTRISLRLSKCPWGCEVYPLSTWPPVGADKTAAKWESMDDTPAIIIEAPCQRTLHCGLTYDHDSGS